jgi:hypothetical protein
MNYKLVNVEKINSKETFDRSILIGEVFDVPYMPVVGKRFYAPHGEKCLITTDVIDIEYDSKGFAVKTKNTIYSFELEV